MLNKELNSKTNNMSLEDTQSHTPMMQQYLAIKRAHSDCLVFYRMGDFFEMFFDDAVIASKELNIALTKRGHQTNGKEIPMCGVPFHAYEAYLAKLINKGFRVAICDQIETPEEAKKRGAKGPLQRDVIRIVTLGTVTEEELLKNVNNYLITISPIIKNKKTICVAIADISTGFLGIESILISELTNILAKWNPAEIVISDETFEQISISIEPWKKHLTLLAKSRFNENSAKLLLEEVYDVKSLGIFGIKQPQEIQAAGVLIDYITTTNCSRNISLLPPKIIQSSDFLYIDAATRKNLELSQAQSPDGFSLFSVINKTATSAGKRLLLNRLNSPLVDIKRIEKRLNKIDFFLKNSAVCKNIQEILLHTADIERILSRICVRRFSPRDLGALKDTLNKVVIIHEILSKTEESHNFTWLKNLTGFENLRNLLTQALNEELPLLARDGNFIKDNFDEQLYKYRHFKEQAKEALFNMQNRYIKETGISNLKIKSNNIWGIYIEVNATQVPKIPFNFEHKQTLTNCSRYTTQELRELESEINNSEQLSLAKELEILENLCTNVISNHSTIVNLAQTLADIDVASSNAFCALQNNYVRPEFSEEFVLEISKGRHPIVEKSFDNQDVSFTTNDCFFNTDSCRFLLVTGPNMAGKSTYLRQTALIVIMAQAGIFVPAEKALIGIVDKIFSRIGASDDIASGRSTFMVEMVETAAILHQATSRSLVIFDEIGRGTATYDGLSIAWAVSEYVYDSIKCRTLFATHYHELAKLTESRKGMKPVTAKIHEWEGKIIFLYKIVEGQALKSYGIHVAQLAGLPKAVLLRASELLESFEKNKQIEVKNLKLNEKTVNPNHRTLW